MKALHEDKEHTLTPAILPGYFEVEKEFESEKWPTIERDHKKAIDGDLIKVTIKELGELDTWEDHYRRRLVYTDKGPAWAYAFKET